MEGVRRNVRWEGEAGGKDSGRRKGSKGWRTAKWKGWGRRDGERRQNWLREKERERMVRRKYKEERGCGKVERKRKGQVRKEC